MMKSNGLKLLKIILAVCAFTGLLLLLNRQISQSKKDQEQLVRQQESRLDVAIVNEDQGGEFEGEVYNLAKSYIKQLEKDTDHNWTVVSRSTAELGLDNGTYQLAVFIPSNFTSKLLDINAVAPEKTTVTYKVNSSGNATIESLANQTGNKIIADLNQQLVDMFMASILGNLYTAQQNVQAVVNTQDKNISAYEDSIYNNALNFRNGLPSLMENAQTSWLSNDQLISSLTETGTLYDSLQTGQTAYSSQLASLLEQRASGQLNYADFVAQLLEMNNLVTDNTALYEMVKTNQEQLVTNLGTQEAGLVSTNITANTQLQTLLEELNAQRENLETQINDISTSAGNALKEYYGIDKDLGNITVEAFLNNYDTKKDNKATLNDLKSSLETVDGALSNLLGQLPSTDLTTVNALLGYSSYKVPEDTDFSAVLNRYPEVSLNDGLLKDLEVSHQSMKTLTDQLASEVKTGEVLVDNTSGIFDNAELTITSSTAAISVDASSYSSKLGDLPNDVVPLNFNYSVGLLTEGESSKIAITLDVPGKESTSETTTEMVKQTVKIPVEKIVGTGDEATTEIVEEEYEVDVEEKTTTIAGERLGFALKVDYPADLSSYATDHAKEVFETYSFLAGQTVQTYQLVHLLSTTLPEQTLTSLTQSYLDQPMDDYLSALVTAILSPSMSAHQETLQKLNDSIAELEGSMGTLTTQLEEMSTQATASSESITELLAYYDSLTQKVTEVQNAQTSDASSQEEFSTSLQELLPEFESLSTSTQNVASSTQQNLTEAENIKSTLTSFESNISTAESSATDLSSQAEGLMTAFNEELSKNQDFVGAFVKVLNNAYNEGVPNEVLLDFLANPVKEESQATKATTNVYKPFTWILLIEVVSLLTAYLFSNSRIFKTTMDKFAKSSNPLLRASSKTVIVNQMFSLLLGLFIGLASLNQLNIDPKYNGLWVMAVTLIMLFLSQWQYLLLTYLKASGMGIALFVLVSYIYLTSAIGTTATLSGFPLMMRNINILAFFENMLSGFFVDQPASGMKLLLVTLGLLGGIALGLFVKPKTTETLV